MGWREIDFFGNPAESWLIAAAIVAVVLLLVALLRAFLRHKLSHAVNTDTDVDDLLKDLVGRTRLFLIFLPVVYAASRALALPAPAASVLRVGAILSFLAQLGLWLAGVIDYWLTRQKRLKSDPSSLTTITAFGFLLKMGVWSIVVLLALDNLGIEITALVAGLGIGGVAVALATQNILGDLFASLSIVVDKPFVLGDFIQVGDFLGTVEHIGLKTTRVRSLSGEQIVFSNGDLLQSRLRNYKRMTERRVVFRFGLVYQTPASKLEKVAAIVRDVVTRQQLTRFDRAHFQKFGDSSLDFEVVYWVLDADYNVFMDIQQRINLELVRMFEREKLEFAYPTRTLHVQNAPAGGAIEEDAAALGAQRYGGKVG